MTKRLHALTFALALLAAGPAGAFTPGGLLVSSGDQVLEVDPALGVIGSVAAGGELEMAAGISKACDGRILVIDYADGQVLEIDELGAQVEVGQVEDAIDVEVGEDCDAYVVAWTGAVVRVKPGLPPSHNETIASGLGILTSIARRDDGAFLVTSETAGDVFKVTPGGSVSTHLSGDPLHAPTGIDYEPGTGDRAVLDGSVDLPCGFFQVCPEPIELLVREGGGWSALASNAFEKAWGVALLEDAVIVADYQGDRLLRFDRATGAETTLDTLEAPFFVAIYRADCGDRLGNDLDGLVDMADPGCEDLEDPSEKTPDLECDDGLDNDGDGQIDYAADLWNTPAGADPSCRRMDQPTEAAQCSNGIDDDGDGMIDASVTGCSPYDCPAYMNVDPGCRNRGPWAREDAACGDLIDNDGDGLTDAEEGAACLSNYSANRQFESEELETFSTGGTGGSGGSCGLLGAEALLVAWLVVRRRIR